MNAVDVPEAEAHRLVLLLVCVVSESARGRQQVSTRVRTVQFHPCVFVGLSVAFKRRECVNISGDFLAVY